MAKYGEEKPGNIVNPVSNFNSFSDIPFVIGKPFAKNCNFGEKKCREMPQKYLSKLKSST